MVGSFSPIANSPFAKGVVMTLLSSRILRCVAALTLSLSLANAADAQALRWKFEKGETLRYEWVEKSETKIEAGGGGLSNVLESMEMTWTVDSVDGDKARISQTIQKIKMSMDSSLSKFTYDTTARENRPADAIGSGFATILDNVADAKTTFTLSAQGEATNIAFDHKTLKGLSELHPESLGAPSSSLDVLKVGILSVATPLPEMTMPLVKGKTWTRIVKIPDPPFGEKVLDAKFSFLGAEKKAGAGMFKIGVDSKGKMVPDPKNRVAPKRVKSLRSSGSFLFDERAGNVFSSKIVERVKETIKFKGNLYDQSVKKTWTVTRRD